MTQQQVNSAVAEVKGLVENSEWTIDDVDVMDGFVYITICRPQTENEK